MAAGPKTAIVTGGAGGIGLAIVEHFLSQGHNVAVFDVNIDSGNELVSRLAAQSPEAKVIFKECDVSSWKNQAEAFKEVYTEFGKIDIVVANAGISEQGGNAMASIDHGDPQEPNLKVMGVNLSGVIYCESSFFINHYPVINRTHTKDFKAVKLAVHYMVKNAPTGTSRGSIICTASNAGLYPFPVSPLYAASKAGVIGLVRSTARCFESHQIQINGLAPAVLGISP